ncbi:MAG: PhoH family protein [Kiritimatiellales bacterium]|nr:PhoH family protein [Kiritimatiellales bacterium]
MNSSVVHFDNACEARDMCALLAGLTEKIEMDSALSVTVRDMKICLEGEEPVREEICRFLEDLRIARNQTALDPRAVAYAYDEFRRGEKKIFSKLSSIRIDVSPKKPSIFPRTLGQQIYLNTIIGNSITFGIGPAGTGKTYLAMAMAVSALIKGDVSRIILTRPAIEAGESLGFLPGDIQQKISPYLRPLYDALHDMLPPENIESDIEKGIIEVAPLAYMRGRTLNHAFVILDEAQNTTPQQMLMFLTRMGFDSRCAITGDLTQIDLPDRKSSGLLEARHLLGNIDDLRFVELTERDVVRHPLVQKVIEAYRKKRCNRHAGEKKAQDEI